MHQSQTSSCDPQADQGQRTLFSYLGIYCTSIRPSVALIGFRSRGVPHYSNGQASSSQQVALCNVPGGSAEHSPSAPLQINPRRPSVPTGRPGFWPLAVVGRIVRSLASHPTLSLHNLTAPKAARSRNQLFEASNKLSPYMTWLHESLFRISLSLHVGFISFSTSLFICSNIYTSFPHVPLPKLLSAS